MIKGKYRYLPKRFIMNKNEYRLFKLLSDALANTNYYIVPQVHLDELVRPFNTADRVYSFRHINQKSVDFVICDKKGMVPLLAIELDGNSHNNLSTQDRDAEVTRILKEIGLKFIRFNNTDLLQPAIVIGKINEIIK